MKQRCEQLGYQLIRLELDRVYRKVIALADGKKTIEDGDVSAIADSVRTESERPKVAEPQAR